MTRNVTGTAINLCIHRIVESIEYTRFHEANRDYDLVADPTSWNKEDFKDWRHLGKPKCIAAFTPEQKRQDGLWKEYARKDLSIRTERPQQQQRRHQKLYQTKRSFQT